MSSRGDPYRELEIYLEKAQEDIGKAFDDLLQHEKNSLKYSSGRPETVLLPPPAFRSSPSPDKPTYRTDGKIKNGAGDTASTNKTDNTHSSELHRSYCLQKSLSSSEYERFSASRTNCFNSSSGNKSKLSGYRENATISVFHPLTLHEVSNITFRQNSLPNTNYTGSKLLNGDSNDCKLFSKDQKLLSSDRRYYVRQKSLPDTYLSRSFEEDECSQTYPRPPSGDVNLLSIWADNLVLAIDKSLDLENSFDSTSPLSDYSLSPNRPDNNNTWFSNASKIDPSDLDVQKERCDSKENLIQTNLSNGHFKVMSPSPDSGICQIGSDCLDASEDLDKFIKCGYGYDAVPYRSKSSLHDNDCVLDITQCVTPPPAKFSDQSCQSYSLSSSSERTNHNKISESDKSLSRHNVVTQFNDSLLKLAGNHNLFFADDILGIDDSKNYIRQEDRVTSRTSDGVEVYPVVVTTQSIHGPPLKCSVTNVKSSSENSTSLSLSSESSNSNIEFSDGCTLERHFDKRTVDGVIIPVANSKTLPKVVARDDEKERYSCSLPKDTFRSCGNSTAGPQRSSSFSAVSSMSQVSMKDLAEFMHKVKTSTYHPPPQADAWNNKIENVQESFNCDAITQTTPVPLSRSSSFTWVTECDCSEWDSSNGQSISEDSSLGGPQIISESNKQNLQVSCKSSTSSLSSDDGGYDPPQNSGCSSLYLSACSDAGSSLSSASSFEEPTSKSKKVFANSTTNVATGEQAKQAESSVSVMRQTSLPSENRTSSAAINGPSSLVYPKESEMCGTSTSPGQPIEANVLVVNGLGGKSVSAPVLRDKKRYNGSTLPSSKTADGIPRVKFDIQRTNSAMELRELQAIEACNWLRATGFPQYAQLYEDHLFPIDVDTVQQDHAFLQGDLIDSLFRRVNTLNRCARMKIPDNPPRPANAIGEQEQFALSSNWQFQRVVQRWSRVITDQPTNTCRGAEAASPKPTESDTISKKHLTPEETYCSSYDSVFLEDQRSSPDSFRKSEDRHSDRNLPVVTFRDAGDNSPESSSGSGGTSSYVLDDSQNKKVEDKRKDLHRNGSDRFRKGAKALLRRMESLKKKKKKKFPISAADSSRAGNIGTDGSSCSSMSPSPLAARPCTSISVSYDNSDCSQESTPQMSHRKKGLRTPDKDEYEIGAHSDSECLPFADDWDGDDVGDAELKRQNTLTVPKSSGAYPKKRPIQFKTMHISDASTSASPSPSRRLSPYRSRLERHNENDENKRTSQYDNLPAPLAVFNSGYVDCIERHAEAGISQSLAIYQVEHGHIDGDIIIATTDRRDSGVGSSLTRSSSPCYSPWHCFPELQIPIQASPIVFPLTELTAPQLVQLRKLALLQLTALIERFSPSSRTGWTWTIPQFIRRFRAPDYKDKLVFGVPNDVVLQRIGQPMPPAIYAALEYLRLTALSAVGIFRKSGVKSRIQRLRDHIEEGASPVDFENHQCYDVADLVKQYFRELPESLMTSKISEMFIALFQQIPDDLRLDAIRAAIVLMPDENREVLQYILAFLQEVTQHADENQMNATNLAVCFAPSLFHLTVPTGTSVSPLRKKVVGHPDARQLNENRAAYECLTVMIMNNQLLYSVPESTVAQSRIYQMENRELDTLNEVSLYIRNNDDRWKLYVEGCVQSLLKEAKDRYKGWTGSSQIDNVDVTYKKVDDDHQLRLWKVSTEIEAPPTEVLNCLLRERHLWDSSFVKWKVVRSLARDAEIIQFVVSSIPPHPNCHFCILRSWRTELLKGACVLIENSIDYPEVCAARDEVRGIILDSRYLIEPCGSGKSRVTHICRIDTRGRSPDWYNTAYGYICAQDIIKLRKSFSHVRTEGPETKV